MKISNLCLSLCVLTLISACGDPLVEFGMNADGGTARDSGSAAIDSGQPRSDSGVAFGDAGATGGDGGLNRDAGVITPAVTSTSPLNNSSGASVSVSPVATFNTPMQPSTINDLTFTLKRGAMLVNAAVSYAGNKATLNPDANLLPNTTYTATITTGATSLGGVPLANTFTWSFTTENNPSVISTTPPDNGVDAGINVSATATFSTQMNPATINTMTLTLKQGTTPVPSVVTYGGTTATINPTANLLPNTLYTATITTGAASASGLPLVTNAVWSFTTGSSRAGPSILSTCPSNTANGVSTTALICARFDKQMDPLTITSATFGVNQGLTTVNGTVSYDVATATAFFTPLSPMSLGLPYTATVTTGAKDIAGNPLLIDYVWSWTTGACGQLPISLKSAASFAVLAGSTVTSTGPTSIIGDLGVSPGTAVTGFGPGAIVGTQHTGDPTAAQGIADLTTAYNEAAGRTLCPVSVAGNLGGQTLAPGLYKSTSSLAVSSGDLTLDAQGDDTAVFIFQMASTLTTTSGRQVILTNGAQAKNVFWQVGTSATFGSTSVFAGTVMADQAITMQTGATIDGRVLARIAAVSFDSNTVVRPAP